MLLLAFVQFDLLPPPPPPPHPVKPFLIPEGFHFFFLAVSLQKLKVEQSVRGEGNGEKKEKKRTQQ